MQHAVSFADRRGLLLSVRGGGHSAPGYGTNNGGMVVDLSSMKGISVDSAKRIARAEGGVLWREFDTATQLRGGGGNFGVVTALEFSLHPGPEQICMLDRAGPAELAVGGYDLGRKDIIHVTSASFSTERNWRPSAPAVCRQRSGIP